MSNLVRNELLSRVTVPFCISTLMYEVSSCSLSLSALDIVMIFFLF